MKTSTSNKENRAFTLTEVLLTIVIVAVVVMLLLPAMIRPPPYSASNCLSNLKQVGLAFKLWAGDNGDHYPMGLITNEGYAPLFTNGLTAIRCFQLMSNELSNPKIVWCPGDTQRSAPTNFFSDFRGTNISYFVGAQADQTLPQSFLAGDSNITNGTNLKDGIMELTTNRPFGFTKARHKYSGNIAFGDGSVQGLNNSNLQHALQITGLATNRLLFP